MTDAQCSRCKHQAFIGGFVDGPMWDCDKLDDPDMPFNMNSDTFCPCFEEVELDE